MIVLNDIKLDVSELDERHFGIYYKIFHQILFNDKSDILNVNKFLENVDTTNFQEKSNYYAHHQLLFKYPSYSYDTIDKLIIQPIADQNIGKLSNPYHCHKPYIPGIECIHECQYGYSSICAGSTTTGLNINSPYKIIQKKTFNDLKWSQDPDPAQFINPQCCSIAVPQTCTPYSDKITFYSESNPSIITKLSATINVPFGGVAPSTNSQLFPFDGQSLSYQIKCKHNDLKLINHGLMAQYTLNSELSYSRFCQFQDIHPYHGIISGPDPDCRGPTVFSISNSPLQKPLIWEESKSFLLNDFKCEYQNNLQFNLNSNTIPIYARISTKTKRFMDYNVIFMIHQTQQRSNLFVVHCYL